MTVNSASPSEPRTPAAGRRTLAVFAALLRRDLTERHQGSLLGVGWALLQPLLQLAVLSLVFTHLLTSRGGSGDLPYAAFLALGLWPWQMFANAVTRGTTALTDNAALIGKVAVPHVLYVLARVAGAMLPDLLGALLVLATMWAFALPLLASGLPVALLAWTVLSAYALAAALAVSVLQVFVRDVAQGVGQLLTLGFFLSPVLYARDQLPSAFATALAWNPLAAPIESIRHALLGEPVGYAAFGASAAGAVLALWLAWRMFRRAQPHVEDFL